MVPFERPKRNIHQVQDDDISLADLPHSHAETQNRRGSDDGDDGKPFEANKGSDVQSFAVEDPVMDPNDLGKDGKASSEHNDASPNQDAFHRRKGYLLSSANDGRSGGAGSERWRGDRNEKREESRLMRIWRVSLRHLRFVGPGLVNSVAYFDPGNWNVDLSAGSAFGYKLLSVILLAIIGAVILQVLSLRLGIATSTSLPAQIRRLFLRIREHPRVAPYVWRRRATMAGLYTLYGLAELAIIAADLAELLGSAIALNLIFPRLPLYAGVLITAVDALFVLAFFQRSDRGRKGMLVFEGLIVGLVLCVFVCFVILIIQIKPDWPAVFKGYVPSSTIIEPKALYTSVGVIGATVMPHALFLGSHLATVDRLDIAPRPPTTREKPFLVRGFSGRELWRVVPERWRPLGGTEKLRLELRRGAVLHQGHTTIQGEDVAAAVSPRGQDKKDPVVDEEIEHMIMKDQARYDAEMNTFDRVKYASIHIGHATIDTVLSLFGFAVTINSSILILASAAFFYGGNEAARKAGAEGDLFSAHALIEQRISKPAAFIFALALFCAGQSASITATLSGQVVSEGFIEWKTSPFVRRVVTRLLGVIPSTVVAVAIGRDGLNQMLVASQVMISVVLPFVIFPLVWLCADEKVMTVRNAPSGRENECVTVVEAVGGSHSSPEARSESVDNTLSGDIRSHELVSSPSATLPASDIAQATRAPSIPLSDKLRLLFVRMFWLVRHGSMSAPPVCNIEAPKSRSFKSHWSTTAFGYAFFTVVTVANAYVLLMLMIGKA